MLLIFTFATIPLILYILLFFHAIRNFFISKFKFSLLLCKLPDFTYNLFSSLCLKINAKFIIVFSMDTKQLKKLILFFKIPVFLSFFYWLCTPTIGNVLNFSQESFVINVTHLLSYLWYVKTMKLDKIKNLLIITLLFKTLFFPKLSVLIQYWQNYIILPILILLSSDVFYFWLNLTQISSR